MKMAAVDGHPADDLLVRDLDRLHGHVGGKAVRDALADVLDGDVGVRLAVHAAREVIGSAPPHQRPKSPKGSSRSRTASFQPASAARRAHAYPSGVCRAMPSMKVLSAWLCVRPADSTA